jgi:hypothetical protein
MGIGIPRTVLVTFFLSYCSAFQLVTLPSSHTLTDPKLKTTSRLGLLNDEANSWWGQTSVVNGDQVQTYVKHRYDDDFEDNLYPVTESESWWGRSELFNHNRVQTYVKPNYSYVGRDRDYDVYNDYAMDEPYYGRRYNNGYNNQYGRTYGNTYDRYYGLGYNRYASGALHHGARNYDYDINYDYEPIHYSSRYGRSGAVSADESKSWWGHTAVVNKDQVQTYVKQNHDQGMYQYN